MKIIFTLIVLQFIFLVNGYCELPSVIKAVQDYVMKKHDYPEVFKDRSVYPVKIIKVIADDFHDDGITEVFVHTKPHYRQSPTIVIYRVTKDLIVTRVLEGLAPGPIIPANNDYSDSHVDFDGKGAMAMDFSNMVVMPPALFPGVGLLFNWAW